MSDDPRFAYIARASCGCVYAVHMDNADTYTRQAVAEWMKEGAAIERHPWKSAVDTLTLVCLHKPHYGFPPDHRVECPECWKRVKVTRDGRLYAHRAPGSPSWARRNCTGTGRGIDGKAA